MIEKLPILAHQATYILARRFDEDLPKGHNKHGFLQGPDRLLGIGI